jgi:uncharacterized alpha-E superfamily protein
MAAMLALSGLSAESMVRDEGWHFMEAGRRLERGLQLCALLGATVAERRDEPTDSLVMESVLTAAESIVTYRRRYRSAAGVESLLDLLLLDVTNPRSLAFQVRRLADAVGGMPTPAPDPSGGQEVGSTVVALVDELATLVALADTNELAPRRDGAPSALPAFLGQVESLLSSIADQLDAAHFFHQIPQLAVAPMQLQGIVGSTAPGGVGP